MDLKNDVIPVTELKNRTKFILARVVKTHQPVLVTQKGRSIVVIVDVEEFQRQQKRLWLLEAIAKGERDIAEGRFLTHEQVKERISHWKAKRR